MKNNNLHVPIAMYHYANLILGNENLHAVHSWLMTKVLDIKMKLAFR